MHLTPAAPERVTPTPPKIPPPVDAVSLPTRVRRYPAPAVAKAKECVNLVDEVPLTAGLQYERREFWSAFSYEGKQEGMAAFLEKREPSWTE
eukprot:CAMPEP_0177590870 /NCGR_PEP_ID=MMETSP0419_2-20121207/7662_1 /TAXON_ID=582737 /ORGANISM="Tetraselmis sp., Strain GSL018" /LENGTH=91 /DNA_ID=CAMNT_0019081509 /DNA_START=549 /DNA_END=824 /DNA_ORIENTATION=-